MKLQCLLFSFCCHFVLLVLLAHDFSKDNTPSIEVTMIENEKKSQKPLKPEYPGKPLIPGPGEGSDQKDEKIDLTDYANQVKLKVDPVWVRNIKGFNKKFYLEVLLLIDKRGSIISVKVIKSSGYVELDECAVATFREVANLPIPPKKVVEGGITWELSN